MITRIVKVGSSSAMEVCEVESCIQAHRIGRSTALEQLDCVKKNTTLRISCDGSNMSCAWSSIVGFYYFMCSVYTVLESKEATSVCETGLSSLDK